MTTLVNTSNKGPSSKKKGRSKKAHVLAVSVEQATHNFLDKGEQIAKDSQDLKEELIAAVEDVRKQGKLDLYDHSSVLLQLLADAGQKVLLSMSCVLQTIIQCPILLFIYLL